MGPAAGLLTANRLEDGLAYVLAIVEKVVAYEPSGWRARTIFSRRIYHAALHRIAAVDDDLRVGVECRIRVTSSLLPVSNE